MFRVEMSSLALWASLDDRAISLPPFSEALSIFFHDLFNSKMGHSKISNLVILRVDFLSTGVIILLHKQILLTSLSEVEAFVCLHTIQTS